VCSICVGPLVICALMDAPSVYGEYTLYDEDMSVYSEFTLYKVLLYPFINCYTRNRMHSPIVNTVLIPL
jgi:hypothetical protein